MGWWRGGVRKQAKPLSRRGSDARPLNHSITQSLRISGAAVTLVPPRRRPVFLLALALLVILPMVGARDVVTSHEARVLQTARQLAAVGWPWAAQPVAVPV